MSEVTAPAAPAAAPAAAAEPTIKLVNTGRGPLQIAAGVLRPNSANSLDVPKSLAAQLMRAYPHVKDASSIFPDAADITSLKATNEALRQKANALEQLLAKADLDKAAAVKAEKQRADALDAQVVDLAQRLREFLSAASKKDLDSLQAKHADAVPEPAAPAESAAPAAPAGA